MGRTTKQEVESISGQLQVSMHRTIKALGVAKSTVYYKVKAYPDRKRTPRKELEQGAKAAILTITSQKWCAQGKGGIGTRPRSGVIPLQGTSIHERRKPAYQKGPSGQVVRIRAK